MTFTDLPGGQTLWFILAIAAIAALIVVVVLRMRGTKNDPPQMQAPPTKPAEKPASPPPKTQADEQTSEAAAAAEPLEEQPSEVEQAEVDRTVVEALEEPAAAVDKPESTQSRMVRLRTRLAGSGAIGRALLRVFSQDALSEADWEEIEDTLLIADLGVDLATEIVENLREQVRVQGISDPAQIKAVLHSMLVNELEHHPGRALDLTSDPAVVLVVGVNGTGKTTFCGRLARLLVAQDKSVLLGAADTFRAAAAEQLSTWGHNVGVEVVRGADGQDPASVAYQSVATAIADEKQVVVVDTAGRLHNKADLMDELGKIKRVIEKQAPLSEILLVLDATTGQNGMNQAKIFAQAAPVTGIVLTKLDGSAKGGIVFAVQRELGVPVKFVGLGEGADDLAPFDSEDFVTQLLTAPAQN